MSTTLIFSNVVTFLIREVVKKFTYDKETFEMMLGKWKSTFNKEDWLQTEFF